MVLTFTLSWFHFSCIVNDYYEQFFLTFFNWCTLSLTCDFYYCNIVLYFCFNIQKWTAWDIQWTCMKWLSLLWFYQLYFFIFDKVYDIFSPYFFVMNSYLPISEWCLNIFKQCTIAIGTKLWIWNEEYLLSFNVSRSSLVNAKQTKSKILIYSNHQ